MFKDDITGKPLVVSNKSTQAINQALVSALRNGDITEEQYKMTYAEVVEIGRLPQMFGGKPVDQEELAHWKNRKSWK